jgi:RimJ/RimL family protein N-acetyltransferase
MAALVHVLEWPVKDDLMKWPIRLPSDLSDGDLSLRQYRSEDAAELFCALQDERAWTHIPREVPVDATALDSGIHAKLADRQRLVLTARLAGLVVGTTSVLYDLSAPDGAEIGGTQFNPTVWGSGVNTRSKQLLLRELFRQGALSVQFRTDERNLRSAAAIRKLGATEIGVREHDLQRRDGTWRRSVIFRLPRPQM